MSPGQFERGDLAGEIAAILAETGLEAAARDLSPGAAFRRQVPRIIELPLVLVAIVEEALVQRGHHFQRIANTDHELGAWPELRDRLELFRRIQIADRAFREEGRALAVPKIEVEISVANDLAQVRRLAAAKIMHQEIMRFLRRRETDVGVLAEIFRHCGRSAARRSDDECPARRFVEAGCECPLFQDDLPCCCRVPPIGDIRMSFDKEQDVPRSCIGG